MILQFTSLIILNQSLYLTCILFILGPEWLKEIREQIVNNQKYTVQVFPGEYGYLNSASGEKFTIHSSDNTEYWRTHFTQAEINEFKKHDDLAIDWDKAIIEPVKAEN